MDVALRLLRTGMLTVAWIMVVPCLAILLGAIVPIVPWFRIYAVDILPNHTSWLFLWSIAGLLIGLLANQMERSRIALALVATAVVAILVTAGVMLHLLYVAQSNGARINVVKALDLREFSSGAKADETRIYSRTPGEDLSLDIYRPGPREAGGLSPVLIAVHGGGFYQGSRKFGAANLRWYADHGWTVISIDYRLARDDRPTWDLAARDVECALAWTATHAGELRIDLNRVTLSGGSAGGTLALTAGYLANAGRVRSDCGPSVPRIAAIIVKAPLVDFTGSWNLGGELGDEQRSYLTRYIGGSPKQYPDRYAALDLGRLRFPTNPPTLITGGAQDPILPAAAATEFVRKATAAGLPMRQILFPYSGHEFNTTYDSITNQALRQINAQFIVENRAGPNIPGLTFVD